MATSKRTTGTLDGGTGRGVPIGKQRKLRDTDDLNDVPDVPEVDSEVDLDEFIDEGDENPGDRRRDPLRRP